MLILFYNFTNVLNVSWGNEFIGQDNYGLSCSCFHWSFIGILKYCLVFSGVCEEKNHACNDWTGLFLKLYLRWLQNELDNWKEKFTKTCLAQSLPDLCADWDTSLGRGVLLICILHFCLHICYLWLETGEFICWIFSLLLGFLHSIVGSNYLDTFVKVFWNSYCLVEVYL